MFTIGDFARYGRVSVRMLHHYDAIGLLKPSRVDVVTGYRFYDARQLAALTRIVALKDLGFTLAEVRSLVENAITVDELRGKLALRRALDLAPPNSLIEALLFTPPVRALAQRLYFHRRGSDRESFEAWSAAWAKDDMTPRDEAASRELRCI
jgi:DNA-binding transcriptional MerR regulator